MVRKGVVALAIVLVGTAVFALCLVTAMQGLAPRKMPFGVTGSSPVISAVQDKDPKALDLIDYSSEAELIQAAEQGDLYGGYIPGNSADTLVTVQAQSFFGEIYVRGGFMEAAKKNNRAITTKVIAPLPTSDRTGAVVGLLLLPTLLGGYLIAAMLFAFTQRAGPARNGGQRHRTRCWASLTGPPDVHLRSTCAARDRPRRRRKTTAMRALTMAWTQDGGQVLGLAPSAAAAAVLAEQTGIRSDTLAKLTWSLQHDDLPDWAAAA